MNFQPLGTSGTTELSDCKRYLVTRAWNSERWEAWLQAAVGPNERLAKNLEDKDAAYQACVHHERSKSSQTTGAT